MSDCPVPPPLDPSADQIQSSLPSILAEMKIPTCKEAGGGTKVAWGLVSAGVSGSIGCDQLAVVATKFVQTENVLTCIMNKHRQTVSMNVVGIQHIKWNTSAGTHIKCKNFIINQTMKIDYYEEGKFTSAAKQEMSDKLIDMVHEMVSTTQNTRSNTTKSAQGNKIFQDAMSQISDQITSKTMNEVVQESLNNIQARQEIELDWKGTQLDAENCEINQSVLLRAAVHNMMASAIDQTMSLDKVTDFFQDVVDDQKTQADELGSGSSMFIIAAIVLVVILLGSGFMGGIFKYLIPILMIVDIVFLIIYATKKKWVLTGIFGAGLVVLLIAEVVSVSSSKKKPGLPGMMQGVAGRVGGYLPQQYQQSYQPQYQQQYMPGVYAPMYSPQPAPQMASAPRPMPVSPA